jgi:hypothetical protein
MQFKNLRSVHWALFIALVFTSACSFDNVEDLLPPPPEFCDTAQVSFSNDIITILQMNCANKSFNNFGGDCHQAGSSIADYTTYAGVKQKVDEGKLETRALIEKSMPPSYSNGPRPDSLQLQMIQCWIDKGALNN